MMIPIMIGKEISPKIRLAQFKQHYKPFPTIGMKVGVMTDDNGYWKIALMHGPDRVKEKHTCFE